jgi:hypothetical protein
VYIDFGFIRTLNNGPLQLSVILFKPISRCFVAACCWQTKANQYWLYSTFCQFSFIVLLDMHVEMKADVRKQRRGLRQCLRYIFITKVGTN